MSETCDPKQSFSGNIKINFTVNVQKANIICKTLVTIPIVKRVRKRIPDIFSVY